ncbi:MAG: pantetheine-phosphate adenylyltransferase [Akkermansia sp.]|nr:pantetheine-phosphate adenylyltransferase [Akkermansia sp.]
MKRTAVYAGSFDPPTNGHLWMIQQGAALFDELVVALAVNPDKPGFFSREERLAVLREMVGDIPGNVRVEAVNHGFLVDFARELGANYLLRGIRNTIDLEYEKPMARMNARMEPSIQSVFLMPPGELEHVSSSYVRGFVGVTGWERWVEACVPPCVYRLIASRA